ncbi:unnamed protein product [Miscanthus lutarioriparius]|uniref:Arginine decarboxylase n=1 Tax=Miscanthus lutarioriparius TaxID=422564 RepID=A0A811R6H2_9POAL|nr:unnamed protein product [Miscanthus lutarioriparius]
MAKNYGELYNILGWGEPYFTMNSLGHLCAKPHGRETTPGQEIDVDSVIQKVLAGSTNDGKEVQFPMILRFPDVIKVRLDSLHAAFKDAVHSTGYKNRYQGVYPMKVNQNRDIIQDLVRFGYDESGVEAASKPELLIAMGCLTKAKPGAYLVCNGYKDADFISLVLSTEMVYKAVSEAAGIYCNLVNKYGAPMTMLDCGGGLGVDYDGTRSGASDMSVATWRTGWRSTRPASCWRRGSSATTTRAMITHHSMIILEALSAIPEPPEDETCDQLLSKILDLSSKQPRMAGHYGGSDADLYSHATELQKQGIEMYKPAKKMCKRVTSDANTIYNYHMNHSVFSLVADY